MGRRNETLRRRASIKRSVTSRVHRGSQVNPRLENNCPDIARWIAWLFWATAPRTRTRWIAPTAFGLRDVESLFKRSHRYCHSDSPLLLRWKTGAFGGVSAPQRNRRMAADGIGDGGNAALGLSRLA